jgi:hypothetical protein
MEMSETEFNDLTAEVTRTIADDMALWLYDKSRSPKHFYMELLYGIVSDRDNVVTDNGLCKWIMDRRLLVDEYIKTIQNSKIQIDR